MKRFMFSRVIAMSMSSSQGMNPLWRTAPSSVPPSSQYSICSFLQIRSTSSRMLSCLSWHLRRFSAVCWLMY